MSGHGVWVGTRIVRTVNGANNTMPFARCSCGWEGPGRLERSVALQDALDHQDENSDPVLDLQ